MRKIICILTVILLTSTMLLSQEWDKEQIQIKETIQKSYVDGLQNKGEVSDIEKGFHPGFNLLGVNRDMLTKYPIYSWVQSHEMRKIKDPTPPSKEDKVTCNYLNIDVTGNAAMAKIELVKHKKVIFTDYLQLYKFEEGWKIVSKIYYRH